MRRGGRGRGRATGVTALVGGATGCTVGVGVTTGEACVVGVDTAGVEPEGVELFAATLGFGGGGLATASLIAGAEAREPSTGVGTAERRGGVCSTIVSPARRMWPMPNAIANTPIRTARRAATRRSSPRRPTGLMRRRSRGCVLMRPDSSSTCRTW